MIKLQAFAYHALTSAQKSGGCSAVRETVAATAALQLLETGRSHADLTCAGVEAVRALEAWVALHLAKARPQSLARYGTPLLSVPRASFLAVGILIRWLPPNEGVEATLAGAAPTMRSTEVTPACG